MIHSKINEPILSQKEMSDKNITSVFDNFGTGERIYYQGDEPVGDGPVIEEPIKD